VKRTRPLLLLLLAIFGGALGWITQIALTASGAAAVIPSYALAVALVVIGVLVIVAAVPVRRAVRDRSRNRIDPFYATRVVVLAKTVAIAGAIFVGAALGMLVFFLTRPVIAGVGSIFACIAAAVAAVLLLSAGLIAEFMCSLPPDDTDKGEQNPATTKPF
jgi:hypothetical protein